MDRNEHLNTLTEIRSLMERSNRFISLSGLSGVWAGLCALAGAYMAYRWLGVSPLRPLGEDTYYRIAVGRNHWGMDYITAFGLIAFLVIAVAVLGGVFFTTRKARKKGLKVWDATSRRLLTSLAVPLVTGGLFCLTLIHNGLFGIVAPVTLIFYGLALVHAAKYTIRQVEILGYMEIALGLLGCIYWGHGLELWALGFGVLHIVYGTWMHLKYGD